MKIRGANLGDKEVEYKLLAEHIYFEDEDKQETLKKLEKLYIDFFEKSKGIEINSFPQNENKVELLPGMINHRCSSSIESLRAISEYGILASEWFGEIESEREGLFCTFIDRVHSEEKFEGWSKQRAKQLNRQMLKAGSSILGGGLVLLFIDEKNPITQKLLHLDYFEYIKNKQLNYEKLAEIYTSDEIEIMEKLIEPYSASSKNYHTEDILPYCDWSAIPGGIPSALINGICTKNINYTKEYIEELKSLFPNATIFNGDLEIIYTPIKEKNTEELGKESLAKKREERPEETSNQSFKDIFDNAKKEGKLNDLLQTSYRNINLNQSDLNKVYSNISKTKQNTQTLNNENREGR